MISGFNGESYIMAKDFLNYNPYQPTLLPPSPQDWLPEDHLAYQIVDVISQLDMHPFLVNYSSDGRGAQAYSPIMMTSLLLYAWCLNVYSSRKIEALSFNDIGARMITGSNRPDHRSINNFRLRQADALCTLFEQSAKLCQRAGMVSLVHLAIDGTKIEANASKRKAMSYGRMVEEEARLRAEIEGYLRRAQEEDAKEDALLVPDLDKITPGGKHRRSENRLAKLTAARQALEAEAQAAAKAKQKEREEKEQQSDKPLRGRKPDLSETPKDSAQRSFTDPESRIMKGADGAFIQAYNGQAAVDADYQVIVACGLTQNANDKNELVSMVEKTIGQTGCRPDIVLADPGYYSQENTSAMDTLDIHALIPPDRERCSSPSNPPPALSEEAFAALAAKEKMRHLVSTAEGRDAYRRRKFIVEPVFGQMKGSAGNPGCRGFLRRGLKKCTEEWTWLCARHNFMKYIRYRTAENSPPFALKQSKITLQRPESAFQTLKMAI